MLNTRITLSVLLGVAGLACDPGGVDTGTTGSPPTSSTSGETGTPTENSTTGSSSTSDDPASTSTASATTSGGSGSTGAPFTCLPAPPSSVFLETEVAPLKDGAFDATVESTCTVDVQTSHRVELSCADGTEVLIREVEGEVINFQMLPASVNLELFHIAQVVTGNASELVLRDDAGTLLLAYKDKSNDDLSPTWAERLQPVSVSLTDSDCQEEVPVYCASCVSRTATFTEAGNETLLLHGEQGLVGSAWTAVVSRNIDCEVECDAGEIRPLNLALIHSSLL